jgi:hypothetical protein
MHRRGSWATGHFHSVQIITEPIPKLLQQKNRVNLDYIDMILSNVKLLRDGRFFLSACIPLGWSDSWIDPSYKT